MGIDFITYIGLAITAFLVIWHAKRCGAFGDDSSQDD